jgi:hypothetical protein
VRKLSEKRRVTSDEQIGLKRLAGIISIFHFKELEDRIQSIRYGKRDFAMVEKALDRLFAALSDTIPDEQRPTLSRNMQNISVNIGIKRPVTSTYDDDFGLWLSYSAIDGIINAARETCVLCSKTGKEQHSCPLRKGLDELPVTKINDTKGQCPYYGRI